MALNFAINIKADTSESDKAASSLAKLDNIIKQESRSLGVLERQFRDLNKAGSVSLDMGRKLSSAIDAQKNKVAGLTDSLLRAGGTGFAAATPAAGKLDNVLAELTQRATGAAGMLGKLGPYGIAAAAGLALATGATLALGGAIGFLGAKLLALGVQASEAKGDVTRSLELLYGGQKAAEHTYKVLESLTGDIAISQGRVMELADTLIKAGQVNGDAMVRSIAAIGKAEAARKGAGQVIEGVITRSQQARMFSISRSELMSVGLSYRELAKEISKGTGMAVGDAELRLRTGGVKLKAGLDALTRVIDTKMGDLANKKFMTVSVQADRLRTNFSRLFEGVNAGPFARVLQVIADQLQESSVSGSALRVLLRSAFDEISKATEAALPYIQDFFETAILLGLKFYNAMYPVRQSLAKLFPGKEGVSGFQDSTLAFVERMAKGFDKAAAAIKWMIDHVSDLAKVIELASKISSVGSISGAAGLGADLAQKLVGGDKGEKDKAKSRGEQVAAGVAAGVRAGTPAVESAMAEMGKKATNAFDRTMQIQSPSKVMKVRGLYIDQGLAQGVNDNSDAPAQALAGVGNKLASVPLSVSAKAPGAAAGGQPINFVVNFHERAIVIEGGGSVDQTMAQLEDRLTETMVSVFEKVAAMAGATEVKGAA